MLEPSFERFWVDAYPPRFHPKQGGCGKYVKDDVVGARREWNKLTSKEKSLAFDVAMKLERGESTQYLPHARKWLKDKRWNDIVVSEIEDTLTINIISEEEALRNAGLK
jgi:hypothetical protein